MLAIEKPSASECSRRCLVVGFDWQTSVRADLARARTSAYSGRDHSDHLLPTRVCVIDRCAVTICSWHNVHTRSGMNRCKKNGNMLIEVMSTIEKSYRKDN